MTKAYENLVFIYNADGTVLTDVHHKDEAQEQVAARLRERIQQLGYHRKMAIKAFYDYLLSAAGSYNKITKVVVVPLKKPLSQTNISKMLGISRQTLILYNKELETEGYQITKRAIFKIVNN